MINSSQWSVVTTTTATTTITTTTSSSSNHLYVYIIIITRELGSLSVAVACTVQNLPAGRAVEKFVATTHNRTTPIDYYTEQAAPAQVATPIFSVVVLYSSMCSCGYNRS